MKINQLPLSLNNEEFKILQKEFHGWHKQWILTSDKKTGKIIKNYDIILWNFMLYGYAFRKSEVSKLL